MTALVLALLAGWSTLRLLGADRRVPWRVVDLSRPTSRAPSRPPPPRPRRQTRRRRRPSPRDDDLARDLPAAVDLLRLAVSAGHSLHTAVTACAATGSGPVAAALADAVDTFERGGRLADGLERLPERFGPAVRPLSTTLVVAVSSGAPLGPALQRLADSERRRLRRRTEERVRRLPVLLLGPLLGLILPAFVLLTVVPVGITTARIGLEPVTTAIPHHPDREEPS